MMVLTKIIPTLNLLQAADREYNTTFSINQYTGRIALNRPLDYEKHSYYQFKIMAEVRINLMHIL